MPSSIPRIYLVAGTLEPFFHENATRGQSALRDAGADVVMTERVAFARRRAVARRVPAGGGVGVRRMSRLNVVIRSGAAVPECHDPGDEHVVYVALGTCGTIGRQRMT